MKRIRDRRLALSVAFVLACTPILVLAQDKPFFRINPLSSSSSGVPPTTNPPTSNPNSPGPDDVEGIGDLSVYGPTLIRSRVGEAVSRPFFVTTGTGPFTWENIGTPLPGGFSLSGSSIVGAWTAAGRTEGVMLQVTDSTGRIGLSMPFDLEGYDDSPTGGEVTLDQSAYGGKKDAAFSTGMPSTSLPGDVTWSLAPESAPLPAGLQIDAATGVISGRPTAGGTYPNIVVQASNGSEVAKSSPTSLTLVVASLAYAFSGVAEGRAMSIQPTIDNVAGPALYELDPASAPIPAGLALDPATGEIAGTPTAAASVTNLRLRVTDADGVVALAGPYAFLIAAATVGLASETLPSAVSYNGGAATRLNVTYLLDGFVHDARPSLAPGQSVEIVYDQPVRADGVYLNSTYGNAPTYRVDAETATGWEVIRTGLTNANSTYQQSFGRTVTASRYRVVNTSSTVTIGQVRAWPTYQNRKANLVGVTKVENPYAKYGMPLSRGLPVGTSVDLSVTLQEPTSNSVGTYQFQAPYTFELFRPDGYYNWDEAYFSLPPGLSLDPATGRVSGTVSGITWAVGQSGLASNKRQTFIRVTDAAGYVIYAPYQSFMANVTANAGVAPPREILLNGTSLTGEQKAQLLVGTLSQNVPTGSDIILKYDDAVALNTIRMVATASMGGGVAVSNDDGANWYAVPLTATTSGTSPNVVTLMTASEVVSARWVRIKAGGTWRGLKVGLDGTLPASPTFQYLATGTSYTVNIGQSVDMPATVTGLYAPLTFEPYPGGETLEHGLSVNPQTGAIEGQPNDIQTRRAYSIRVTDSYGLQMSAVTTLGVNTTNTAAGATARKFAANGSAMGPIDTAVLKAKTGSGFSMAPNESIVIEFDRAVRADTFAARHQSGRGYNLQVSDGSVLPNGTERWFGVSGITNGTGSVQTYNSASMPMSFRKMRVLAYDQSYGQFYGMSAGNGDANAYP